MPTTTPEERYLDLLKRSLTNQLYLENEARLVYVYLSLLSGSPIDAGTLRNIEKDNHPILQTLRQRREEGAIHFIWDYLDTQTQSRKRANLRDVTEVAHTMIGNKRLDNIHSCIDTLRQQQIPGDLMETGVWRGGAVVFMRGYLAAYGITDRKVWAADSFEGLPKPSLPQDAGCDFSADVVPVLAISLDEVKALFDKYGLLDDQVQFIKGWFSASLPSAPIERLALLRLDGDLYESTRDALVHLYDKVSPGGFIIVDDYWDFEPCRTAVDEFRAENGIENPIQRIDWTGVYWRRSM